VAKSLQAIRGMNDLRPEAAPIWRYVEDTMRHTLDQYGYQEIRTPVVESTHLFKRSVGEHTDVVEKEMYTFEDRNGDSLTLRPECTAGIVRAGIQHGLFYNQIQRLWTIGQLFRHERPQKGRYRQFHQLSVETFGISGPEADTELILLNARLWKALGIDQCLSLEINTLGTTEERIAYKKALVHYLTQHEHSLDEDSKRRLSTNPLRILDSKDEATQGIITNAPKIHDYLSEASQNEFNHLLAILDKNHISYTINSTLVRGLDYYCKTVFEWTTDALGAQSTVCGGGRYDVLVEMLGGKPTPATGFGLGIERLILLLETTHHLPELINRPIDVVMVAVGEVSLYAMALAEQIRDTLPSLKLLVSVSGSLKSQLKRADRSGANIALIIGEDESMNQQITVKYLREDKAQKTCRFDELIQLLM